MSAEHSRDEIGICPSSAIRRLSVASIIRTYCMDFFQILVLAAPLPYTPEHF